MSILRIVRAISLTAGVLAGASIAQATAKWGIDSDGNWEEASNWLNSAPPVAGDEVQIDCRNLFDTNVNVSLSSTTPVLAAVNVGKSAGKVGTLNLLDGASLTTASGKSLYIGGFGTGTVNQYADSIVQAGSYLSVGQTDGGVGTYNLYGGTLSINGDIRVGEGGTGGSGTMRIAGGTVTWGSNTFFAGDQKTGIVEISGGNVGNDQGGMKVGYNDTYNVGTLRIIGSKAVIDPTTFTQYAGNTLEVYLDNGGISTIQASTASVNGILKAGIKGGAALLASPTVTIISSTSAVTNDFATKPDSAMWTTDKTGTGYRITLAASTEQAALDASTTSSSSFAAAGMGHLVLNNVDTTKPLAIYLDVDPGTGKTLADLVTFFGTSDFAATTVTGLGDYDIQLTVDHPAATTQYFAWDLSGFNADATISGVATAVPEPAAAGLLAGGIAMLALRRRRRPDLARS